MQKPEEKSTARAERIMDEVRTDEALHTRYRPTVWKHVLGQDAAVKMLSGMVARRESHAFLLVGGSGVGKTTLARIAAAELGAAANDIKEYDAASNSGVDAMRAIKEACEYLPFGDSKARVLIIDECHGLSKQAWDVMLKKTEEPPAHIFWFFCTTNPGKVPATIKTRCTLVTLKEVKEDDLWNLFDYVHDQEQMDLPDDVAKLVVREANGSPRQLLNNLATCRDVTSKREAAELLRTVADSDTVRELCQFLAKGGSWQKAMGIYQRLEGEPPEGVRINVTRYFAKVAVGAKSEGAACAALTVLEAFATPYDTAEGPGPLLRSIGRVLFQPG